MRLAMWVQHQSEGEMIESSGYTRAYLNLPPRISQEDLDAVCRFFNMYIESRVIISNHMGEIIPKIIPRCKKLK
jgi:hypothetical protein